MICDDTRYLPNRRFSGFRILDFCHVDVVQISIPRFLPREWFTYYIVQIRTCKELVGLLRSHQELVGIIRIYQELLGVPRRHWDFLGVTRNYRTIHFSLDKTQLLRSRGSRGGSRGDRGGLYHLLCFKGWGTSTTTKNSLLHISKLLQFRCILRCFKQSD